MFTRRFFVVLAGCLAVSLLALWYSPLLLVAKALVSMLGVCVLADAVATFLVSRRLKVGRSAAEHFSLAQPNKVTMQVSLSLPSWMAPFINVYTYDTPPYSMIASASPVLHGVGELSYSLSPVTRGRYDFGVMRVFVRSRVPGLFEWRRFIDVPTVVKVFPTFHHLDDLELQASMHSAIGSKRQRRAGNSTEFEQIRPYVAGDDVRAINWRATARAVNLMVNSYTDERSRPVVPIICAGPSMLVASDGITLLDRAVSAAVALASAAVRHYDEAGLITVTHQGVESFLRPERSPSTVSRMLRHTYDFGLPPTQSERQYIDDPDVLPDGISHADLQALQYRVTTCEADPDLEVLSTYVLSHLVRRSLLALFANFENMEVARRALPALRRLARKHTLIVVLFIDEKVDAVARAPYRQQKVSERLSEMRVRNMCADYLEQQQRLAEHLRAAGINVLLTTPKALSTAVLQQYLDIKNRML